MSPTVSKRNRKPKAEIIVRSIGVPSARGLEAVARLLLTMPGTDKLDDGIQPTANIQAAKLSE